jgi:hypothetical protein
MPISRAHIFRVYINGKSHKYGIKNFEFCEAKSGCLQPESAERSKCQTGKIVKKYATIYCRKCDVGLCVGLCFEVYQLKLNYWE